MFNSINPLYRKTNNEEENLQQTIEGIQDYKEKCEKLSSQVEESNTSFNEALKELNTEKNAIKIIDQILWLINDSKKVEEVQEQKASVEVKNIKKDLKTKTTKYNQKTEELNKQITTLQEQAKANQNEIKKTAQIAQLTTEIRETSNRLTNKTLSEEKATMINNLQEAIKKEKKK